jgi:predicted alpha-1,2-mannosidase
MSSVINRCQSRFSRAAQCHGAQIALGLAPHFKCLQTMKTHVLKPMSATLSLMSLLVCCATSCVMRPIAESSGPAIGTMTSHAPVYAIQNLVQFAKPMCGTAADGDLFPGAVAPFGMIQWSPDTGTGQHYGGYAYEDSLIGGFSLDHLSGAGCNYGENFAFMPILGMVTISPNTSHTAFLTPFSHDQETAKPGYYAVTLGNGVKVELTATERSGFGRFTYPASGTATMVINASSSVNGTKQSAIQIHPAQHEITGWVVGGHFCGGPDEGTTYFCAIFNHPFGSYGIWSDATLTSGGTNGNGQASGAYVSFNLSSDRTVLVKTAISYVSITNARVNLETENPLSAFSSKDFDKAVAVASHIWNSCMNRIQVSGGTTAELETFYSMLYHVLLGPTICSDVNGEFRGYDCQVHRTMNHREQYANFSGWDIYRSECQLLAMLVPWRASDMAQSLLVDYQQGGAFPRWGVPNEDSGVMMGDPAAPIIADFYAFGAANFDTSAALSGLLRAATDPTVWAPRTGTHERDALADYLKLGYVPEHQTGGYGNVSMTLEYDSADFALSQFAKALGDEADNTMLLRQAQNWENLFNPQTGYIQMRRRDGSWAPGFIDNVESYDSHQAYVEGTAAQYVWMVPFNLKGLAAMMGGPEITAKRLDVFFTRLNDGTDSRYAYLGNEPCLETPWEYCFWGRPYETQKVVRQAITQLFSSAPHGYPGNDDLGEMSSWYVLGALGMYPELPGSDVLVLGSPLFQQAVLHLQSGDVTILGSGAADYAPYVQSLTVNGQTWNKPWIHFHDIVRGGRLIYTLGTTPAADWGSSPLDAPPSFTVVSDPDRRSILSITRGENLVSN